LVADQFGDVLSLPREVAAHQPVRGQLGVVGHDRHLIDPPGDLLQEACTRRYSPRCALGWLGYLLLRVQLAHVAAEFLQDLQHPRRARVHVAKLPPWAMTPKTSSTGRQMT